MKWYVSLFEDSSGNGCFCYELLAYKRRVSVFSIRWLADNEALLANVAPLTASAALIETFPPVYGIPVAQRAASRAGPRIFNGLADQVRLQSVNKIAAVN